VIPVYSLLLVCVLPLPRAHETAGATGTRHSPRPPWGREIYQRLGRNASRARSRMWTRRHSGMVRRTRPGISRFRVRCFASPRNDGYGFTRCLKIESALARAEHPRSDHLAPLAGRRRKNPHRSKFCNKKFSAVLANTCMLATRSVLPVSSVIADGTNPATPMQLWPAASP
jgi:hypothetical protein